MQKIRGSLRGGFQRGGECVQSCQQRGAFVCFKGERQGELSAERFDFVQRARASFVNFTDGGNAAERRRQRFPARGELRRGVFDQRREVADLRGIPRNQRIEIAPRRTRLFEQGRDPEMKLGETLGGVGGLASFKRVRDVFDFAGALGEFIKERSPAA